MFTATFAAMKRIFLLLLTATLLFTACSFKDKAERRLNGYLSSIVADPDFSIEEKEIAYEDGSLCIIQFKLRAKNAFGGYVFSKCEYILSREDDLTYEHVVFLDKETSICELAKWRARDGLGSYDEGKYRDELHRLAFDVAVKYGSFVEH